MDFIADIFKKEDFSNIKFTHDENQNKKTESVPKWNKYKKVVIVAVWRY